MISSQPFQFAVTCGTKCGVHRHFEGVVFRRKTRVRNPLTKRTESGAFLTGFLSISSFHAGDSSPSFRIAERLEVTVARLLFGLLPPEMEQARSGHKQRPKKQLNFYAPADAELMGFYYLRCRFIKNSQYKNPSLMIKSVVVLLLVGLSALTATEISYSQIHCTTKPFFHV
jgi:hypothetical protein